MTQRPNYPKSFDADSFIRLVQILTLKDNISPKYPASIDWLPTNYTETRSLDASTATAQDVADVLCTLINDLKDAGYLG